MAVAGKGGPQRQRYRGGAVYAVAFLPTKKNARCNPHTGCRSRSNIAATNPQSLAAKLIGGASVRIRAYLDGRAFAPRRFLIPLSEYHRRAYFAESVYTKAFGLWHPMKRPIFRWIGRRRHLRGRKQCQHVNVSAALPFAPYNRSLWAALPAACGRVPLRRHRLPLVAIVIRSLPLLGCLACADWEQANDQAKGTWTEPAILLGSDVGLKSGTHRRQRSKRDGTTAAGRSKPKRIVQFQESLVAHEAGPRRFTSAITRHGKATEELAPNRPRGRRPLPVCQRYIHNADTRSSTASLLAAQFVDACFARLDCRLGAWRHRRNTRRQGSDLWPLARHHGRSAANRRSENRRDRCWACPAERACRVDRRGSSLALFREPAILGRNICKMGCVPGCFGHALIRNPSLVGNNRRSAHGKQRLPVCSIGCFSRTAADEARATRCRSAIAADEQTRKSRVGSVLTIDNALRLRNWMTILQPLVKAGSLCRALSP